MKIFKISFSRYRFVHQDFKIEKHNFKLQGGKKIVTKREEDNEKIVHNGLLEIIKIRQANHLKWQSISKRTKKKTYKMFYKVRKWASIKNFTGNTSEKYQLLTLTQKSILDT